MHLQPTPIAGLFLIHLDLHGDSRGFFKENWQKEKFAALAGASRQLKDFTPVQNNISFNASAGVTRGMHAEPWDKLISVAHGEAFGAWIDMRADSPTYRSTFSAPITPDTAVFVPRGVANGFQAQTECTYCYLVNDHWSATADYTFCNLNEIDWPLTPTEISAADRTHPSLAEAQPFNAQKILILGGNGQLGTALRAVFPEADSLTRAELDITAPLSTQRDWNNYHTIINAAAYTKVDDAETHAHEAWATNAQAVANLAEICRDHNITLVHFSTDYVFDGTSPTPYIETDTPCPINVYGNSKAAGELAARSASKHFIIRTSWVVGAGKNFVSTMKHLAENGAHPTVVSDQIGRLTFADDLATAIPLLLERGDYGTYHFSSAGPASSWFDIAQEVWTLLGYDPSHVSACTTEDYAAQAPRPRMSMLALNKIESLGIMPGDWRELLKEKLTRGEL
ncbi:dTDP-4-dehydrorhamnose reductase [Corynebacterium felinum]|uniref:dTDP-4-dehydrorhamnose reductase n=1 Tax=Corynebacterium felinum TaxID=131318 RepID=A0ABU2BAV3_9CORY|nr:dTDP-4-dehydrorhamnose reductase [Corynebacterium felinum]MDF5821173.1 dTDP-4-dehydrorhamnose reductase [Corynebacterium felinum]MDR7354499.1 dTDP-4-dehydrorhamnose 3,5-epimerase [Corynebacterium felinum]WJY93868.1 dTDP-4-dehydrorhamnose reductase [Corynebacterium felinum]